jgi:hypothetical protein
MGYIFLSYSRQQLYFAESVALHLQRAGLEVWFDLQRLGPGVNWSTALEEGYSGCEKLILIASQAALDSPYVQDEWKTAQQKGCEVILVLTEAVDLPEALRACPVYDARTRFDPAIRSLIMYLRGEAPARHDPLPRRSWFPLSLKMPFDVWLTIFVLLMPGLSALVTLIAGLPALGDLGILVYSLYGFIFVILVILVLTTVQFWRHKYSHEVLRRFRWNLFWMQLGASLACGLLAYMGASANVPAATIGYLFLPLPLVNLYWALWVWKRSPDILRWFPSGLADQTMRERIHGKLLPSQGQALPAEEAVLSTIPVRYTLHAHAADKAIVRLIDSVFKKAGHQDVESEADTHLILVTNRTSKQWLLNLDQTLPGKIIYILGTPITNCPELEPAFERQWVDFRKGDLETIQALAGHLTNVGLLPTRYAIQVSPGRFHEHALPGPVSTAQVILMVGLAFPVTWGMMSFTPVGWLAALACIALFFYFDLLLTRKAYLPRLLRWGSRFAWYADRAPAIPDPVGMDEKSKARRNRWIGFALVIVGLIGNMLNQQ